MRRARDRPRPRALHNPSRQIGFSRACRRSRTALRACHTSRPIATRPFIIADYRPDAAGLLVAVWPDVGPCHGRDGLACHVCLNHWRPRSTGPCFPLAVMTCLGHGGAFTLYPPGHVPYGRRAVAAVTLTGAEPDSPQVQGAETLLDAARDASQGKAWHRQCPGGSDTWWSTQGRQLATAVRLFGVAPDLDLAARLAVAAALQQDVLSLLDASKTIVGSPGYRSRGAAVVGVHKRLPRGPCLLQCLVAAGHLAGLWGPPWRWDGQIRQLRRWAFRGDGTRPP